MTIGSMLIGVAALSVVVAYLARPLRSRWITDQAIDTWVAVVRREQAGTCKPAEGEDQPTEGKTDQRSLPTCPGCREAVRQGDQFCSSRGERLRDE